MDNAQINLLTLLNSETSKNVGETGLALIIAIWALKDQPGFDENQFLRSLQRYQKVARPDQVVLRQMLQAMLGTAAPDL